jgi:hypothetical protein
VLNLPDRPGATGYVVLLVGMSLGLALILVGRGRVASRVGGDHVLAALLTAALAATVAGAPFTLWRVLEDIRTTSTLTPEHAEYVGAETKLIDGELVRRIEAAIPRGQTYHVRVAPQAYVEIRESLALWLGYELVPRRQTRALVAADWLVTWGATPDALGLRAGTPTLVGRNRLSEREPVYLARVTS